MIKSAKSPLLFLLGELDGETKHGFFDPIRETFIGVELPELVCQLECLASGHGWLLLVSRPTSRLFFFNPLTRERIDLPYRRSFFSVAAFSAPPTSPDCVVFALEEDLFFGTFNVDALRVGKDKTWTRYTNITCSKNFRVVKQAICSDGVFYCLDCRGRVCSFDPKSGDWKLVSCKAFKVIRHSFFLEFNGELFAVKCGGYGVAEKVYKLRFENGGTGWEEAKGTCDGTSFFVGPFGSCALVDAEDRESQKAFVAREVDRKEVWYTPVWIQRPY